MTNRMLCPYAVFGDLCGEILLEIDGSFIVFHVSKTADIIL